MGVKEIISNIKEKRIQKKEAKAHRHDKEISNHKYFQECLTDFESKGKLDYSEIIKEKNYSLLLAYNKDYNGRSSFVGKEMNKDGDLVRTIFGNKVNNNLEIIEEMVMPNADTLFVYNVYGNYEDNFYKSHHEIESRYLKNISQNEQDQIKLIRSKMENITNNFDAERLISMDNYADVLIPHKKFY